MEVSTDQHKSNAIYLSKIHPVTYCSYASLTTLSVLWLLKLAHWWSYVNTVRFNIKLHRIITRYLQHASLEMLGKWLFRLENRDHADAVFVLSKYHNYVTFRP